MVVLRVFVSVDYCHAYHGGDNYYDGAYHYHWLFSR